MPSSTDVAIRFFFLLFFFGGAGRLFFVLPSLSLSLFFSFFLVIQGVELEGGIEVS